MTALDRTSPSSRGVDAAGLLAFIDATAEAGYEFHSLMVLSAGDVVAEGWWAPYAPERVHLLYSLSKTFTASCLGMLVDEGRIALDAPVVSYLGYVDADSLDEKYQRLTIRHCLNMATGHETDADRIGAGSPLPGPDPGVRAIFQEPPSAEPGSVFCYNQRATYLLGAVIREATGETLLGFARRRLLNPLGIGEARWHTTPDGKELGFSGLHTITEAIARLGLLWLNRGIFQGRRLLSEKWFDAATDFPALHNPAAGGGDWAQGYGFQVWNQRHGYRGDGAFGQFMVILPEQDAIVAITAETERMQGVLDAMWTHLLPALTRGGSVEADAALAERLEGLSLEPWSSGAGFPRAGQWRRVDGNVDGWGDITVESRGHDWELRFSGVEGPIIVGDGAWRESWLERGGATLVLMSSGGWESDGFHCQIRLVESPHVIEVRPAAGGVSVAWRIVPLSGRDPFLLALGVAG